MSGEHSPPLIPTFLHLPSLPVIPAKAGMTYAGDMKTRLLLAALLSLAACAAEEEPVANRFARTNAEIENKARALEAEVENQVRSLESGMQNQIDALANQSNASAPTETNGAAAATNAAR